MSVYNISTYVDIHSNKGISGNTNFMKSIGAKKQLAALDNFFLLFNKIFVKNFARCVLELNKFSSGISFVEISEEDVEEDEEEDSTGLLGRFILAGPAMGVTGLCKSTVVGVCIVSLFTNLL